LLSEEIMLRLPIICPANYYCNPFEKLFYKGCEKFGKFIGKLEELKIPKV
jgi:hypothetical protein